MESCYNFLNNNNIINNLRLWTQTTIFYSHALINVSENMKKALDDRNMGCRVFAHLQNAFYTVDQQILLPKLSRYGIHGVSNNWFKSYISNCNQYVFIKGYDSGFAAINCGVPQGSVLVPSI